MTDGRPQKVSDDDLLDAVQDAIEAGDTDVLNGGVPAGVIADRVPLHKSTVKKHLRRLVESGRLKKVRGAEPESYRPRESYLPADYSTSTVDS